MAENVSARLDHRVPVAQASTRLVGPGWEITGFPQAERRDPAGYHSLGFVPPPSAPTLTPPAPTEAELRTALAAAIEAQHEAEQKSSAATAAAERAQHHVEQCHSVVADFAVLDDDVTAATIAALRTEGRVDLPDDLRRRMASRDTARGDLAAANRAAEVLLRERADALQKAAATARAVDASLAQVLAFRADEIGQQCRELRGEIDRRRRSLLGFDRLVTAHGTAIPLAARVALGEVTAPDVLAADVAPWRRAADALKADPLAAIAVELPELAVAPLPQPSRWTGVVEYAVPIARPVEEELPPAPQDDGDPHLPVPD